jgi:4-methyl-5(b-hydroxyethyl)-thiazole monophosphate biosynthesis
MPKVLVILFDGVEEIEAVTPIDLLRRAGAEVTTASTGDGIHVTGRSGIVLHADAPLNSVGERTFDLLVLPGGPGVKALRADARVRDLVRAQDAAGRWIGAICAAPVVLADAGLLAGRRFTAHTSVAEELPGRLGDERTVVDGRLVTSRGAGTALDFGLVLVERLFSEEKAAEIARSITA